MIFDQTKNRLLLAFAAAALLVVSPVIGEDKKRREPPTVPPVELNGTRYEAVILGSPYGYRQDGGIVIARDVSTGRLKWTQKIYHTDEDPSIESDKQDVFISAIEPTRNGKSLLITNEHGERFELELDERVRCKPPEVRELDPKY